MRTVKLSSGPVAGAGIENTKAWPIRRFVKTARATRRSKIQAGEHTITAAGPLPVT